MFDVNEVQKQAEAEIAAEQSAAAKSRIKNHLLKLAAARKVVANLEAEYQVILADIGTV